MYVMVTGDLVRRDFVESYIVRFGDLVRSVNSTIYK